jgi:hypothetical protein
MKTLARQDLDVVNKTRSNFFRLARPVHAGVASFNSLEFEGIENQPH